MPLEITLPTNCDHVSLFETLFAHGLYGDERFDVKLSVAPGGFFEPSGTSLLVAWALSCKSQGSKVNIKGGDRTYLARMDVLQVLGIKYAEVFSRYSESGRFIPVKLLQSENDAGEACNSICDLVIHLLPDPRPFIPTLQWAVNEIIDNVFVHSQFKSPGVVFAQFYPNLYQLKICICDVGVGIRDSLSELHWWDSDSQAILNALERGVTRNSKIGQGNGLAGTRAILKANGGALSIWSGASTVTFNGQAPALERSHCDIPGTGVLLSFDVRRPVRFEETFITDNEWSFLEAETQRLVEGGGIKVLEHCVHTGGRSPAEKLRKKIEALIPSLEDVSAREAVIEIDFEGATNLASSFLDELIGKLIANITLEAFKRSVRVVNLSEEGRRMLNVVVHQRLQGIE